MSKYRDGDSLIIVCVAVNIPFLLTSEAGAENKSIDLSITLLSFISNPFFAPLGTQYYNTLLVALTTGMRQGEMLGLRWKDVDFTRKTITINQSLSHDGKEFKVPKTECSIRSISLDDDTLEALRQHRKAVIKEKWDAQGLC